MNTPTIAVFAPVAISRLKYATAVCLALIISASNHLLPAQTPGNADLGGGVSLSNQPLSGTVDLSGGDTPGNHPLTGDVDLNSPQATDTHNVATEEEIRNRMLYEIEKALDETAAGKTCLEVLEGIFGNKEEARKWLEEFVKHVSSREFQDSVRRTDQFLRHATTTAEITEATAVFLEVVLAPPAAAAKGIVAVTFALIPVAAGAYTLQGKVLEGRGNAEKNPRLTNYGKELQGLGEAINTVNTYAGKAHSLLTAQTTLANLVVDEFKDRGKDALIDGRKNGSLPSMKFYGGDGKSNYWGGWSDGTLLPSTPPPDEPAIGTFNR